MYQSRARHNLSPVVPTLSDADREILWLVFEGIGDHWQLGEDTSGHRLRLNAFLDNRISSSPLYQGYYKRGSQAARSLIAAHGEPEAYRLLFETATGQPPPSPLPAADWEIVRKRVVEELLVMRLALGGFRAFGALNYRGYFGGALVPGAPPPYRTEA